MLLEEVDRTLIINAILDLYDEDKRTPALYNTLGMIMERHEYTLAGLRKKAGGFEFVEYTESELCEFDVKGLLSILDALCYIYIVEDLKDPAKRKTTLYAAINKFLKRHRVSVNEVIADSNALPETLMGALNDFDNYQSEELH